jgi:predicted double-glycine peptidase
MRDMSIKINLPFNRQINDYYCGPASLQMVFGFLGLNKNQSDLAFLMNTKEDVGTRKSKMVDAVSAHDLHYCEMYNASIRDVSELVSLKVPTVVNFIEPSENDSHYAVIVGMDKKNIILADPWNGNNFQFSKKDFLSRWYGHEDGKKRWLLAVYNKKFSKCSCNRVSVGARSLDF